LTETSRAEVRTLGGRAVRTVIPPLTRAFWSYPEAVHLLPDEHRRRRVLPRYLLSDAVDAAKFGTLFAAVVDGAVAGAAAWIPPHAYPIGAGRQIRQLAVLAPAAPWGIAAMREAVRGRNANREQHRGFARHYYLRAIGVDPSCQGHGIGSSLLEPIFERADIEGVGCFLTTATAANVGWYEARGFAVTAAYRPTSTWPQTWAMWREPRRGPVRSEM